MAKKKRPYADIEKAAAEMTINRQAYYGARGTTPNYVLDQPIDPVPVKGAKKQRRNG